MNSQSQPKQITIRMIRALIDSMLADGTIKRDILISKQQPGFYMVRDGKDLLTERKGLAGVYALLLQIKANPCKRITLKDCRTLARDLYRTGKTDQISITKDSRGYLIWDHSALLIGCHDVRTVYSVLMGIQTGTHDRAGIRKQIKA